ncbi:ABC transporter ATP-binding protein [Chlorobium sp. BLA1]|uniref:ABC transporter ATP-binding protein n=1 Tax=Candidatus Chlorobium masyuteum TaxID=2716876 RepID=UPI0014200F69|nr:ABC transporter ATP-binding protein [Candidatus Chlorobium masyuteum]NHQ59670.1 ABC transporter ATP-binding protein [Candidatus Chlorobium masyuteum]
MSAFLEVQGLEKSFDGVRALSNFSCTVRQGEILGLIGPNGAGKTTFFNIVSGFLRPDSGSINFKGSDLARIPSHRITNFGISRTFQNLRLVSQISVIDNVMLFFQGQPGEKLRNVFFNWWHSQEREHENQKAAIALLEEAGLVEKADNLAEELSYGQQKLLSLVCCLASGSDVLLLDEPLAGIAPEMIENILRIIRDLPGKGKSIILIEHNIDAVMQVCDRVLFMNAGFKVSEGTPDEVRCDPRVIDAYID